MGVVTVRQAVFGNRPRAADAFGDVLPGHLDVNPACVAAFSLVDLEELLHLAKDLREITGLVAAAGLDGVAVHRVALPDDLVAGGLDSDKLLRVSGMADRIRQATEIADKLING